MKFDIPQETLRLIPWGVTVYNPKLNAHGLSREMVAKGDNLAVVVVCRIQRGQEIFETWLTDDCEVKKWQRNTRYTF